MALTQPQVNLLKQMLSMAARDDMAWTIDKIVLVFTAVQQEAAYDFLRTKLIERLDLKILNTDSRKTELINDKTNFPPRI